MLSPEGDCFLERALGLYVSKESRWTTDSYCCERRQLDIFLYLQSAHEERVSQRNGRWQDRPGRATMAGEGECPIQSN